MNGIETKETVNSQNFWDIVFIFSYAIILAVYMQFYGIATMNVLLNISPFHFIILTIATFRMTRLFVSDHITQWMRDMFMIVYFSTDPITGMQNTIRTKRVKGLSRVIGDLFGCQWCMGIWTASLIVVLYVMTMTYSLTIGWVIIILFALAGGASFTQGFASYLSAPRVSDKANEQPSAPSVCTKCS